MKNTTNLSDAVANDILSGLLSVNHGWWCDFIEDFQDKHGHPRQRLKNQPYYSPAFLAMYGYSQEEMSLQAILGADVQPYAIREMKEAMKPGSTGRSGTIVARTKAGKEKLVGTCLPSDAI